MGHHGRRARRRRGENERLEDRQMLAADLTGALEAYEDDLITEVAAIDGSGNNLANPDWGAAGELLQRLSTVEYADGVGDPAGEDRPSAREVSNSVAAQDSLEENDRYLTDFVWLWGQFIDHDLDLSEHADPAEAFDIEVPTGDEYFDPFGTGEVTIGLDRSGYELDEEGVRQQVNEITAYLDASMVYGSDDETAASLRAFEGGRMATSEGDLLPIDEHSFFMAGDVRANENVLLASMHTMWVREHNRLADDLAGADPTLSDEELYQQARALVTAQIQAITYNEWLPALLGVDAIAPYAGYDPSVNAGIANAFSTAGYRFGHSMLSSDLLRLDADGSVADEGGLSLAEAFFSPDELLENGIDSLLRGAAAQLAQEVDTQIVDDVRNFLFGPPGAGGLDLAALNVQRGRDHGLPDYNQLREDYGLARVTSFADITSDAELAAKLEALYGSVDEIDPWVGVLAEDHVAGSSIGELGRTILVEQFTRTRDGDRFWYENRFEGELLDTLRATSLSDVLARNTDVDSVQANVFYGEAVLYFAADPSAPRTEAMLHVQAGELRLIDMASGRMLAASPVDSVDKVVFAGGSGANRVWVHPSAATIDLPGGVVIDGGAGRDAVVLMGVAPRGTVAIDGAFASFGDTSVQLNGVERLIVDAPRRSIDLIEPGDYRVVTHDAPRPDDGPGRRQRRVVEDRPDDRDQRERPIDRVAELDSPLNRAARQSLESGPRGARRGRG